MPETKHTPGPWKVDGQNIVTVHEARIGIGKVFSNIGQPAKANARLIAAAPDLQARIDRLEAENEKLKTEIRTTLQPGRSE